MASVSQIMKARIVERVQRIKLPDTFTVEPCHKLAIEIALVYDLTDEIVKLVENVKEAHKRIVLEEIATPFVRQARCSTDIIMAVLEEITVNGRTVTEDLRAVCTNAYRAVFFAMDDFLHAMETRYVPLT